MIDYRPPLPLMSWQVTVRPAKGEMFKANIFANSLHEARMMGPEITPPHMRPGFVVDVCLAEIAKARQGVQNRP